MSKPEQWIVIPDAHFPFVRKPLWLKVLKLIRDRKIQGIVLAGDFLDLYTLSRYNENSLYNLKHLTLEIEYDSGNEALDQLDEVLSNGCKKVYIFGNHEDRYFREIQKGDRAKYGSALVSPTEALGLRERGYEVLENWMDDYYTIGKHLDVFHGVYIGPNSARKHLEKTGQSCMFGHSHNIQSYRAGERASYNIGTLCDIWSKGFSYCPRLRRMEWGNGFASIIVDDNGYYHVNQVNVYRDKFVFDGKLY